VEQENARLRKELESARKAAQKAVRNAEKRARSAEERASSAEERAARAEKEAGTAKEPTLSSYLGVFFKPIATCNATKSNFKVNQKRNFKRISLKI